MAKKPEVEARARDTRLGRDVAFKVTHADVALDPERVKRFDQEARVWTPLAWCRTDG